jgi:hypothetical protein
MSWKQTEVYRRMSRWVGVGEQALRMFIRSDWSLAPWLRWWTLRFRSKTGGIVKQQDFREDLVSYLCRTVDILASVKASVRSKPWPHPLPAFCIHFRQSSRNLMQLCMFVWVCVCRHKSSWMAVQNPFALDKRTCAGDPFSHGTLPSPSFLFLFIVVYLTTVSQITLDRLCGLVVRVPGYRSRGPRFDSRRYHIFWEIVDLERGPLSLVRIIEEILEWKSSGSGLKPKLTAVGIRCADHATPSIRYSGH